MQNDVNRTVPECIESVNNTTISSTAVETALRPHLRCGNEPTSSSTSNNLSILSTSQSITTGDLVHEVATRQSTERSPPQHTNESRGSVEIALTLQNETTGGSNTETNPPMHFNYKEEETNVCNLKSKVEDQSVTSPPKNCSQVTDVEVVGSTRVAAKMEPSANPMEGHTKGNTPPIEVDSSIVLGQEERAQSISAATNTKYISNISSTISHSSQILSDPTFVVKEQTQQSSDSCSLKQQQEDLPSGVDLLYTTSDKVQRTQVPQSANEDRFEGNKAESDFEPSDSKNSTSFTFLTSATAGAVDPASSMSVQRTNASVVTSTSGAAVPKKAIASDVIESPKSIDEDLARARQPLTDLYGSYVCHTNDTCLQDARDRLKKALNQTWMLRKAFTDRVYSKYRVCLRPAPEPEQVIVNVLADPIGSDQRLRDEIALIREEKEIEKKETVQLNVELAASKDKKAELINVDNAEQLMYFTAGLNLVILPEEQLPLDQAIIYPDRGPINPATGQRVKGISQAAAIAGEVVLERARKSAAMMAERTKRHPFLSAVSSISRPIGDVSCPSALSNIIATTERVVPVPPSYPVPKSFPERPSTINSAPGLVRKTESRLTAIDLKRRKGDSFGRLNRTRHPAHLLSLSNLTTMNPMFDELRSSNMKPGSATSWLISNSSYSKKGAINQFCLSPQSESMVGKRKRPFETSNSSPHVDETDLHLPPLPNRIERSIQKSSLPVLEVEEAVDVDVKTSLRGVLAEFCSSTSSKSILSTTKIGLLGKRKFVDETSLAYNSIHVEKIAKHPVRNQDDARSRFTLSVLCAVGLVKTTKTINEKNFSASIPSPSANLETYQSSRMADSRSILKSSKRTVLGMMKRSDQEITSQKERSSIQSEELKVKASLRRIPLSIPLESIRGGGQVSNDEESELQGDITTKRIPNGTNVGQSSSVIPSDQPNHCDQPRNRQRASSTPGQLPSNNPSIQQPEYLPHIVTSPGNVSTMNASISPFPGMQQQPAFDQLYENAFPFSADSLHHHVASAYMLHHQAAGDLAQNILATQAALIAQQTFEKQSTSGQLSIAWENLENISSHLSNGSQTVSKADSNSPFPVKTEQPLSLVSNVSNNIEVDVSTEHCRNYSGESTGTKCNDSCDLPLEFGVTVDTLQLNVVKTETKVPTDQTTIPDCDNAPKEVLPLGDDVSMLTTVDTEAIDSKLQQGGDKLRFQAPPIPEVMDHRCAQLIQRGKFHEVAGALSDSFQLTSALDYLMDVSSAVPIPKSFVSVTVKEQFNTILSPQIEVPWIPHDVVVAAVMIWLWSNHEQNFQAALSMSGRIDVDPDCKQLVQLAVVASVRALSLEISESLAKGIGAFAEAAMARKMSLSRKLQPDTGKPVISKRVELCTASVVCAALGDELFLDSKTDFWLPNLHSAVDLLDEARLLAFRFKARERTLLANFLSRRSLMDERFSNAFVGSVVRAGEAYGHDQLFEEVQNERVSVSSMLPYDIFTEESGLWEDPARPLHGFSSGLTGEELFRRAHARATIQMSLHKLQERNNLRGGTHSSGPYSDDDVDTFLTTPSIEGLVERSQSGAPSPRPSLKRKVSAAIDASYQPGTGSAPAKNTSVYDPKHSSAPVEWDNRSIAQSPYGIHSFTAKRRAMLAGSKRGETRKVQVKRETIASAPILGSTRKVDYNGTLFRSTHEVNWADVASVFHLVKLPRKSSSSRNRSSSNLSSSDSKIYAPFFHSVSSHGDFFDDDNENSRSDSEEDISDETVLRRHQVILDDMRESLNKVNEARRRQQDNRKNRQK